MKYLMMLLLLPVLAHASEGDAFSARLFTDYKDMEPLLNDEVNRRMAEALVKANKKKHACVPEVAIKAMEGEFLRPVVGVFEFWSSHNNVLQGHYVKIKNSIYKDLKISENWPVQLGKFGMATFFNVNGTLVASDKFGHFFDEGHTYYDMVKRQGLPMQDALDKGISLEEGIYGYERSAVFSYGDLVANRNGYEFWNNLLNAKDGDNYIGCENSKFYLRKQFKFSKYVDDGWDEAINCSKYSNKSVEDRVMKVIADLEKSSGQKLACPAEREKCAAIVKKYQAEKEYLISPMCY
jgi:hypothetical protein